MRVDEWLPVYRTILQEFEFDERADRLARNRLAELVEPFSVDRIDLAGATVAVAGGARSLESEIDVARRANCVVAASDAGARLRAAGLEPDLVVTDLDGRPERTVELAADGIPVAVHAHGDNVGAIRRYVPRMPPAQVLGTTQTTPIAPLVNYGGFTDGDRAAFLADELGADRLCFPGWDLDDRAVGPAKRRKLRWAERLLRWLERRRSERFRVLDGRRSRIDLRRLYR